MPYPGLNRLLIVEDVAEIREWLAEVFRKAIPESKVHLAQNPMEFHTWISRDRPDLVLLDEVLGAGEDLASLIQVAANTSLRVILMTGMYSESAAHGRALPSSVLGRVRKPDWETGTGVDVFLAEIQALWMRDRP